MVCTANDLQKWKDFPKGLRVLLIDGDTNSAAEISAKLEAMEYIVSTFCDENEALSAISSKTEEFHVAIVEVSISSTQDSFKFLENAKDLPTIMTSSEHCLSTMMKCIALGAVEFLSKPLSEDKLRNIWQHVVHKAFNAGTSVLSDSPKPDKESVVSTLKLQMDNGQQENGVSIDLGKVSRSTDNDLDQSVGSDKFPAPSTPQLNQGARLLDDGDCQEQTNCSTEKENGEHEGKSKSVETTRETLCGDGILPPNKPEKTSKEEEDFVDDGSKKENTVSPHPTNKMLLGNIDGGTASPNKAGVRDDPCDTKSNRKKTKVDWTPELHKKFVQAVEQLGVDQAIPSKILELMKVEGLTRHNVASHLQKYRMHKRQILPKEEDRRWLHQRDPIQRGYCLQRPMMAFPPYQSNRTLAPAPVYPMWGQPGSHLPGLQVWSPPGLPVWRPTESWHWKPVSGMHADAWGCPVLPPPQGPCFPYSQQSIPGFRNTNAVNYSSSMPRSTFELNPEEEVIDKVVKEAISKPWLPMPLGLKPPSTDSVLAELSRQGISNIPLGNKGSSDPS
ncbi:hypothetical protein L6164_027999 [Bauhinia variegata]|uniref:Uncharacterized protein n=1 Tax=Bauhinia variegata TaxID=167791 RepID=A0ACB9LWC0_BAUVA|nr:hypothetical protein L6164_027999 [Bauhinia variegata]